MSSFLEDIEFASKVNEAIKEAEQRGIDNSLELTKEMIKQQYGDIEKLQKENKQLKEDKKKARDYIKNGLDFKSLHFIKGQDEDMWKIILIDNIKQDLLRILGDKE